MTGFGISASQLNSTGSAPRGSQSNRSMLDEVGLADARNQRRALLAGNEAGLGIADALLKRPDVLILDEPTTATIPKRRRRSWP